MANYKDSLLHMIGLLGPLKNTKYLKLGILEEIKMLMVHNAEQEVGRSLLWVLEMMQETYKKSSVNAKKYFISATISYLFYNNGVPKEEAYKTTSLLMKHNSNELSYSNTLNRDVFYELLDAIKNGSINATFLEDEYFMTTLGKFFYNFDETCLDNHIKAKPAFKKIIQKLNAAFETHDEKIQTIISRVIRDEANKTA